MKAEVWPPDGARGVEDVVIEITDKTNDMAVRYWAGGDQKTTLVFPKYWSMEKRLFRLARIFRVRLEQSE